MITPILENWILSGKANWKNFTAGYSALFSLIVVPGTYIIIEKFCFIMPGGAITPFDVSDIIVTFESEKTKDNLIMGMSVKLQDFTRDMFSVHYSDVKIRFSRISNLSATDFGVLPTEAQEPAPPNGFGTTVPVDRAFTLDTAGDNYIPLNFKYFNSPLGAGTRNQLFPSINAGTVFPAVTTPVEGSLFNIGYVVVNQAATEKLA